VAAQGYASYDDFAKRSFLYRNEFEDGPITWAYQTWERDDLQFTPVSGQEILGVTA
jgi:hypothetical protein